MNHNVEDLVQELYGLGTVRRTLISHAQDELGSQGFMALAAIVREGPLRVSEVAAHLMVDLSVASRQVGALQAAGYVSRERDADDGRASVLAPTPAGERVLAESHRRMVDEVAEVLDDWPDREVAALTAALARLRADFGATPTKEAAR